MPRSGPRERGYRAGDEAQFRGHERLEEFEDRTGAARVLPPGGALIVYDAIIDDDRRANTFGLLMSVNMLVETQSGFDYTAADCRSWMADVGFRETYTEPLAGPDSMVVGIK